MHSGNYARKAANTETEACRVHQELQVISIGQAKNVLQSFVQRYHTGTKTKRTAKWNIRRDYMLTLTFSTMVSPSSSLINCTK